MYKYLLCCDPNRTVTVDLVDFPRRKFSANLILQKDSPEWSTFFERMWFRGHIKPEGPLFDIEIEGEKVQCGLPDLLAFKKVRDYFDEIKPNIVIASELDWLTFTAYAKLILLNKIQIRSKAVQKFRESHRPKSKKQVLKDWKRQ